MTTRTRTVICLFTAGPTYFPPTDLRDILLAAFPADLDTDCLDPIAEYFLDDLREDPDPTLIDEVMPRYLTPFERNELVRIVSEDIGEVFSDIFNTVPPVRSFPFSTDLDVCMWVAPDAGRAFRWDRLINILDHLAPGTLQRLGLYTTPFEVAFMSGTS